jgi:diguanylate cyclase (GGDEF)-like protein
MNPDQHLLRDMFVSLRGMNLLGACGSLILIALFRDQVNSVPLVAAWLLAIWVLVLAQEYTIRQVPKNQAPSIRRLNVCCAQAVMAGLLWGIAPFIISTQGLWQSTALGIFLGAAALFPAYALAPVAGTYALAAVFCVGPFIVTSFMASDGTFRNGLVAMMIGGITVFSIRLSYLQRKRSRASALSDERARLAEIQLASQSRQLQAVRTRLASAEWQDGLTGVSTLPALCDRLRNLQTANPGFHLIAINVVGFAAINLAYGWEAGNFTLALIARRLTAFIGEPQCVARVGGDEFVLRLSASDHGINQRTRELRTVLEKPVQWGGTAIPIAVAIGVASFPGDATDPVQLAGNALIAMRQAQGRGPAPETVHYDRGSADFARQASSLRWEIMRGLEREEFIVYYQPQVNLASGSFAGAEALVRWRHPERGLLHPDEFIAISEDCGLIVPLGASVLRQTLRDVAAMDPAPPCKIAVNASLSEFSQRNLARRIESALDEFGVAPDVLQIELTESILMSDPKNVIRTIEVLHELGVSVALDDFGTGYSSLSYLHDLPIDNLKLDRLFVRDIPHDKRRMAIASAILKLASDLEIPVTSEGVERREQWDWLQQHGCTCGQGYLIGRPMPLESLRAYREEQAARLRGSVSHQRTGQVH